MPFVIPPDVEELVAHHLASGRYHSGDEVLRSAVRALAAVDGSAGVSPLGCA